MFFSERQTMNEKSWVIRELLNTTWTEELVGFPWAEEDAPAVTGPDGQPVVTQLSAGKVWFVVEKLPALGEVAYRAGASATPAPPCVTVRREQDTAVLSNGVISLRVPAALSGGDTPDGQVLPGPLLALRRGEGPWVGEGRLFASPDQTISDIRFETVEEGPLWCVYAVTYVAGENEYRVEYRLEVGAAYVRIGEHSTLGHDTRWEFDLQPDFAPTRAAYGHHRTWGKTKALDLEYSGRMHLGDVQAPDQPIHYFSDDFDAYTFLNDREALGLCALRDGDWTFLPANPIALRPLAGPRLLWSASCQAGNRHWALFFATADAALQEDYYATPAARMRRKFETTLDWVKDLVLEWDDLPDQERPHAICTREDLQRARDLFKSYAPLRRYGEFLDRGAELVQGQYNSSGHYPLNDEHREDPMSAWLMEPDPQVADVLKRGLLEGIRLRVDAFLGPQGHRAYLAGSIDVGRMLRPFIHMFDLLAPHLHFTPEERRYFRAAVAFLCYKIDSPHYWNAEALVLHSDHPKSAHRTAWFPSRDSDWCTYNLDTAPHNFHIDLYTAMGSAAAIFPGHPCSSRWLDRALSYVERELDNWIFKTGAYIESAVYTLGTMGWWIPFFAVLKHTRVKNYFLDERFQRLGYALARLLGPHDRRIERRSFTVMGDAHYPSGYCNTLAWMAGLGREDPQFSATMMAAWEQSGRQLNAPGQQGQSFYDALFIDPDLPAQPLQDLPSEHLDGLGVILRDSYGTPDEVYFFIKCGKIYSHFHYDEGAFFVFADGVPLLDEYGIQYGSGTDENGQVVPGNAPRCHNAISFSGTPTDRECYNRGYVTRFLSEAYADYAICEMPVHLLYMKPELSLWGFQGEEAPYGWWRRHIFFVKPYGFFFYDQLESEFTATLDLNFKADTYQTVAELSRVYQGRYGTDIPVCLNLPTDGSLRDGRIDMQATAYSFPKFSTMESVAPELKDTFYNQVSLHVGTRPNTDFSWAFAWSRPEAEATLRPLPEGAPGSVLERADGVTRALVAPAFQPAVSVQQEGMIYSGWAGAVTERTGGTVELIQMVGKVIGAATGLQLHGDGPFRAVIEGTRATVEISGAARWLAVHGVPLRRLTLNGHEVETEPAGAPGARRLAVPAGRHQLVAEWD
jgi:hypothetical protein